MDKNVLGTKIKNGNWGKTTQVSKSFQETFTGFTEAKMTSTNPQFMDSSSKTFTGFAWEKMAYSKTPKHGSLLHIHLATQKMNSGHEQMKKRQENREGKTVNNLNYVRETIQPLKTTKM